MATNEGNALLAAYLVVGDDALKRGAVMRRLRMRLEAGGDLSFNFDSFEGATADPQAVVAACQTVPFASEKRLVQVNDADKLRKGGADALVAYLAAPNDTTVLALIAEKLAKNTRLYKAVAALGASAVIDCARPKSHKLRSQVRAMAPTHGITFTDGAAAKLVDLVGEDTVRIDSEIAKIALSHAGSQPVDEREVEALVSRTAEVKPWEFVDAFAARDLPGCLARFPYVVNNTSHGLLTMCVSRIRELMCAKSMLRRAGDPQRALARELGVPDWKVKNHVRWSRSFTDEELRAALSSSFETERTMKSGAQPDAAFLAWIVETLRK